MPDKNKIDWDGTGPSKLEPRDPMAEGPLPTKPDSYGVNDRGANRTPQIRHTRPEVAENCARIIIANNCDYEAAVSKMLAKDYPDATDAQIRAIAETLAKSSHVQLAVKKKLEEIGYGDDALRKLIGLLWEAALDKSNDKRWPAAMRMLGEIMGAQKAAESNTKIPSLVIAGSEEGLRRMLGDAAPTNDDTIIEEDDIDV